MYELRLRPNRRQQFEGYLVTFLVIGFGVVLAIAFWVLWLDADTRLARGAKYMMPPLTVAFAYQTIEQLVRSMIRVEALGISWWTIDRGPAHRRRSSGMIPAAQIEEIAIEGLRPNSSDPSSSTHRRHRAQDPD